MIAEFAFAASISRSMVAMKSIFWSGSLDKSWLRLSRGQGKVLQCFLSNVLQRRLHWTIVERKWDNAKPQFFAAASFKMNADQRQ